MRITILLFLAIPFFGCERREAGAAKTTPQPPACSYDAPWCDAPKPADVATD